MEGRKCGVFAAGRKKKDRHVFARASLRLRLLLKEPKVPFLLSFPRILEAKSHERLVFFLARPVHNEGSNREAHGQET